MTEPVDANSRVYLKDVRPQLSKFMAGLPRNNMTVHVNSFPKSIYDEVKTFANKDGGFGLMAEKKYDKALLAQKIADANGDKKITGSEVEIYDELKELYGKPTIGGVSFSSSDLSSIKTIAKNDDNTYTVKYTKDKQDYTGVYFANTAETVKFSPSVFTAQTIDTQKQIASL